MSDVSVDAADFLRDGPADGRKVVLAHGAGAPMDSPFMAEMAAHLAERGLHAVRFVLKPTSTVGRRGYFRLASSLCRKMSVS